MSKYRALRRSDAGPIPRDKIVTWDGITNLTFGGVVWLTPIMFRPKKRPSPLRGTKSSIGFAEVLANAVTRS